jgi:hypothetical protein
MSQPVKLSDELVLEARTVGSSSQRSIAGQVEFWAKLGRSVEPLLRGDRALSLLQAGEARALSDAVAEADSDEGRQRLKTYLSRRPFPHFEACADEPGVVIKIDEDGTRTRGRFVNREFVAAN